ncbi:MAG: HAD-IA family hydrolase [Gammaproteobacteria bacterium]
MSHAFNMLRNVRTLTFDLDDTLWDNSPVLKAAEQSLYDWLGEHYPRVTARYSLASMRTLRQDLLQTAPELRHDVTRLRKMSLRVVAQSTGYDDSLVEAAFEVFLEARHRVTVYSDVVPALQRLRRAGYRLGTLTNGNADVRRVGLGYLFDFMLLAGSTGRAKPDPHMFDEACRLTRVAPAELAHVGDDPGTDLAGAQTAGVTVVWMNRRSQAAHPGVAHHAEIRDMTELLTLLGLD